MDDRLFEEMEIAPTSVVKQAERGFAAVLANSPQFEALDRAANRLREDQAAQQAMADYQEKQNSLRALLMLNALSPEQKAALDELRDAFVNQPVVQEYFEAQAEFTILCQELGDALSDSIGLNYAASCGASCCS